MSALLFAGPAMPVVARWQDPGDVVRKRNQVKKAPGEPRRVPNVAKDNRRFNPFRQPIGDPTELEFRHANWSNQRTTVRTAMLSCGTSTAVMDRFDNCGAECTVEWSEELKRYRLRASYCRCRHCKPCMAAKAKLVAGNLREKLKAGPTNAADRFRFITLTLKHSRAPLAEQIKNLYRHFKVLRRSELWKSSQIGGAVMFECKLNGKGEWHPHLHVISEGDFIRQHALANYWMKITNGSFKVDVRMIKTGADAANYVAKYVGKGCDDSVWRSPARAQEWVMATRGLRSCATYGTWRGFKLLQHDPHFEATDWTPVALLSRVVAQAAAGSLADQYLLVKLQSALQYDPSRRNPTPTQPLDVS